MKRMGNMAKCILLSVPLLSFMLLYTVNAHALVLTRGTAAADFTGELGTVQVNYVADAPFETGGLTDVDTITIYADEDPPLPNVPIERVQYDIYNASGTDIYEFTVTFPADTVVESAYEPLEYYDSGTGNTVDTGGIAYSTVFNGYGTYHYNSTSSWEIEYQSTSVTFRWVGAGNGLPSGAVIGHSDVPTSLSSFAIEFRDGTALGLQPASFKGGLLAVFTSNGTVLSAADPGVSVNGITYYSTNTYPGVLVELIDYAQEPYDPAAYETYSGEDGFFEFPDVADGEYWLKWNAPDPIFAGWVATHITVAGTAITNDLYLLKDILLDTPTNGAIVTTQNPELCWNRTDPVEATYNLGIYTTDPWASVEYAPGLTGLCYTVTGPLADNTEYEWFITRAQDDFENEVGYTVQAFRFTTNFACPDADSDGVCDSEDNCPDYYNPPQADNDNDLVGDVCDNCPFIANGPEDDENQLNTDEDEMGNICDPCPNDDTNACGQEGVDDGLTAVLQTPSATIPTDYGENVPVEVCQQNPGSADEYTIFDCFSLSYKIKDSSGNLLDTKHKDRVAYIIGIPGSEDDPATPEEMGDVVTIPAGGEKCITCYVEEGVIIPLPTPGEPETFSGDVCSTNFLTDPNTDVNGGCKVNPEDGCFDMKIGTVCAPLEVSVVNRETVEIDIKPGTEPNSINLGSNGKVPVAIMSTSLFDATTIDPVSVELAGATVAFKGKSDNPMTSVSDVNGDGIFDLIVHVDTEGFQLTDVDVSAELKATAKNQAGDDLFIRGEDSIRVVGNNE